MSYQKVFSMIATSRLRIALIRNRARQQMAKRLPIVVVDGWPIVITTIQYALLHAWIYRQYRVYNKRLGYDRATGVPPNRVYN